MPSGLDPPIDVPAGGAEPDEPNDPSDAAWPAGHPGWSTAGVVSGVSGSPPSAGRSPPGGCAPDRRECAYCHSVTRRGSGRRPVADRY